jgi:hypothetical protein
MAAQGKWPSVALIVLFPLGMLSSSIFYSTSTPIATRRGVTAVLCVSLVVMFGCWLLGRPGTIAIYLLLGTAGIAAIGVTAQIVVSLGELLARKQP